MQIGIDTSFNGQLNFNDGLIALSCRERSIHVLASFDRDFDMIDWLARIATPEDVQSLPSDVDSSN